MPDFADSDNFFESPTLQNFTDFMDMYSVIIAFLGSQFYWTMIEPNATFNDIFHADYHAFWNNAYSLNRTFIISDKTFSGSPDGKNAKFKLDNCIF